MTSVVVDFIKFPLSVRINYW